MRKLRMLVVVAASLFAPTVALAEGQTVQGAQEFLRITFASGSVNGSFDWGSGYQVVQQSWYTCRRQMVFAGSEYMPAQYDDVCGNTQYGTWTAPDYRSVAYTASGSCTGTITANAPYFQTDVVEGKTHYSRSSLPPLNRKIDWSKVSQVKKFDNGIDVREGGVGYWFKISSEDLLARTLFAMEFVKNHCDAAASTGF